MRAFWLKLGSVYVSSVAATIIALIIHRLGMGSTYALGIGAVLGVIVDRFIQSRLETANEENPGIAPPASPA